jgi:hypothetical protein
VEPGNLPEIPFQRLKEEGSKPILVHGNFGYGKMALVRYVLQKHAKDLDPLFPGGIFHMKYDPKGEQLLESQRELLRTLVQDPCKVHPLTFILQNHIAHVFKHNCYALGWI